VAELDLKPQEVLICSGIGQAAKLNHYVNATSFTGSMVAPSPTPPEPSRQIPTSSCSTWEETRYVSRGRQPHDPHDKAKSRLTVLSHDNSVYGLTKGQASPTSPLGFVSPTTPKGVTSVPFNPIAVCRRLRRLICGAGLSRRHRANQGDRKEGNLTQRVFVGQRPAARVTFNRVNTYQWFKQHTLLFGR
jgi:2-oxoglutarate ferredoxin oxidoreductase subunit beta